MQLYIPLMDPIFTIENLFKFITLSGLEVVLGIDNVIFIAVITYNVPKDVRLKIQFFGIGLAIILRILMLFGVSWLMGLTKTICEFHNITFSGKSFLLIAGGAFLVIKSGIELMKALHISSYADSPESRSHDASKHLNVILQIVFVDLILSFDSVIVAVGMVNKLYLIIPAIFVAMVAMLVSADAIGKFLHTNPSIKVLGLAFVLIIGLALMLDGLSFTIPKSYLYTAMFFSLFVELINIRVRKLKGY